MKILAIGFHKGALDSLRDVIDEIDTWLVPIDKNEFHYNMTRDRALMLWEKYKEKFDSYGAIITTDTTALSRIFLEGKYQGRLIIWICNRFDYADGSFLFDRGYYDLLRNTMQMNNVRVAAYSKYDKIYASKEGIYVDDVIKPVFKPRAGNDVFDGGYYMPDYQNNYTFDIANRTLFPIKTGRHTDEELKSFYSIVHLPYHWQGVAEMSALRYLIPYYVPTKQLLFNLLATGKYWFQNQVDVYKYIDLCNFYDKENKAVFYFDSIDDIHPIEVDRNKIYVYAKKLYLYNKSKWEYLLWS
jgi:hypothetical protein